MAKRIITTENLEEDVKIESHLRPTLLKDYIGQEKAKETLKIYIEAAKASRRISGSCICSMVLRDLGRRLLQELLQMDGSQCKDHVWSGD